VLAAPSSLPDSACGWTTFSPTDFTLEPGATGQVRVSVSVPAEVPAGEYRLGLFFEEHSVVPPQVGTTRRLVLRYRLSTLVYVMVPRLERKLLVREVEATDVSGTLSLHAVLENAGSMHLRPETWVEVLDAEGRLLLRTEPHPTMVLLPGRSLDVETDLTEPPPPARPVRIRYLVDVGRDLPLQATSLSIGERK